MISIFTTPTCFESKRYMRRRLANIKCKIRWQFFSLSHINIHSLQYIGMCYITKSCVCLHIPSRITDITNLELMPKWILKHSVSWTPTCCVSLNQRAEMQWASQSQSASYVNQRGRKQRHVGSLPPCLPALRKLRARRPSLAIISTSRRNTSRKYSAVIFGADVFPLRADIVRVNHIFDDGYHLFIVCPQTRFDARNFVWSVCSLET